MAKNVTDDELLKAIEMLGAAGNAKRAAAGDGERYAIAKTVYLFKAMALLHQARCSEPRFRLLTLLSNLAYILPRKTRERVFEPAYQDLLADYLETRRKPGRWLQRWLDCCFAFQSFLMVFDCFWALAKDRSGQLLVALVPEVVRRWLS